MLFLDEPHVAVVKIVLLQYQPELRIIEMHGGRIGLVVRRVVPAGE